MDINADANELREHWFLSHLSDKEFEELFEQSTSVTYRKRETIVKKGEFATHLIMIQHGFAKIEVEQGRRTFILDIVPHGNIVGMPVALNSPKHLFSIVPLTDAEVHFIPVEKIKEILENNGKVAMAAIQYSNSSFVIPMLEKLQSISQNNIRGRLAKLLLYLSIRTHCSNEFSLLITRYEIAQMIGFSRENVIRILSEFHAEGILKVKGKNVEIVDLNRLEDLARYS